MQLSTVLSGVAVLVLFGLFFRAVRALPLVALPLVIGVVWTAAAAQLLYGRINAVSLAFGTILVSIGIDVPIQLYNRLREELAQQAAARRARDDGAHARRPVADGDAGAGRGLLRLRAVELPRARRARRARRRRADPQLAGDADAVSGAAGAPAVVVVGAAGARLAHRRPVGAARAPRRRAAAAPVGDRGRRRRGGSAAGLARALRSAPVVAAGVDAAGARAGGARAQVRRARARAHRAGRGPRPRARARARRPVAGRARAAAPRVDWCAATRRRARCSRRRRRSGCVGRCCSAAPGRRRRAAATRARERRLRPVAVRAVPATARRRRADADARRSGGAGSSAFWCARTCTTMPGGARSRPTSIPAPGAETARRRGAAWLRARAGGRCRHRRAACSRARCCRFAVARHLARHRSQRARGRAPARPLLPTVAAVGGGDAAAGAGVGPVRRRARRARPAAQSVQPARGAAGDRLRHRRSHLPRASLRSGAGGRPRASAGDHRARHRADLAVDDGRVSPGWRWRASMGCACSGCRARWRCCCACWRRSRCCRRC